MYVTVSLHIPGTQYDDVTDPQSWERLLASAAFIGVEGPVVVDEVLEVLTDAQRDAKDDALTPRRDANPPNDDPPATP